MDVAIRRMGEGILLADFSFAAGEGRVIDIARPMPRAQFDRVAIYRSGDWRILDPDGAPCETRRPGDISSEMGGDAPRAGRYRIESVTGGRYLCFYPAARAAPFRHRVVRLAAGAVHEIQPPRLFFLLEGEARLAAETRGAGWAHRADVQPLPFQAVGAVTGLEFWR